MIRFLQTKDNRLVKIIFIVIIAVAIGTMVITLVPGIMADTNSSSSDTYATVQPVSYQEAARMDAESGPPQDRRYAAGPYGYPGPAAGYAPPPPGYAPYPYAYGYPYPGPYVYADPRAYVYGYPYYYRRWR